jgi:hypothetical protein
LTKHRGRVRERETEKARRRPRPNQPLLACQGKKTRAAGKTSTERPPVPRQPKVGERDPPRPVHQDVGRLEVSVEVPARVQVVRRGQDLRHDPLELALEERSVEPADPLLEVELVVVHDHEHLVGGVPHHHFLGGDDRLVRQRHEDVDLAERRDGEPLPPDPPAVPLLPLLLRGDERGRGRAAAAPRLAVALQRELDLLERDRFPRVHVPRQPHHPVRPLAHLPDPLVAVVHPPAPVPERVVKRGHQRGICRRPLGGRGSGGGGRGGAKFFFRRGFSFLAPPVLASPVLRARLLAAAAAALVLARGRRPSVPPLSHRKSRANKVCAFSRLLWTTRGSKNGPTVAADEEPDAMIISAARSIFS